MATRNIARTAIEGGRRKGCRYREHESTRKERAQSRLRLQRAARDPAYYAEEVFVENRYAFVPWIDRDFADKLSPVYRWLESKVGQPWSQVYGEIRSRFDFRTTAGRHIVGHIEFWVNVHRQCPLFWRFVRVDNGRIEVSPVSRFDFEIDDRGILCFGDWRHGRRR